MGLKKLELPEADHAFIGKWHIYEMSMWDEDYFNMETQAYIEIEPNNLGDFQFGLVTGSLDGYIEKPGDKERFSFTWEGCDEMDEASGSGWLELNGNGEVEGLIGFHMGDRSTFQAKKVSQMNLGLIKLINEVFKDTTVEIPPMTLRAGNAVGSYDLPTAYDEQLDQLRSCT